MVAPATLPELSPSRAAGPLPATLLADIAAGIARVPDAWRHVVRHDPDGRKPVRLLATDAYEVWVIGWTKGQSVRPHDHGRSAAAVLVVDGSLTEVDLLGNRRCLAPGGVLQLVPGVVHDVINQRDQPATSIHVYSPPLTEMTYYDSETWEADETVHLDHEQPVLTGWHGASLLHPARRRSS